MSNIFKSFIFILHQAKTMNLSFTNKEQVFLPSKCIIHAQVRNKVSWIALHDQLSPFK